MVLWIFPWLRLFLICWYMIVDHENSNPNENSGSIPIWILQFFCLKKITFHVKVLQKQSLEMLYKKKAVLKICTTFPGNHLCWTLFLDSLFKLQTFQAFRPATLLKRDSKTGVSCKYCKIFKNPILKNMCERLLLVLIHGQILNLEH